MQQGLTPVTLRHFEISENDLKRGDLLGSGIYAKVNHGELNSVPVSIKTWVLKHCATDVEMELSRYCTTHHPNIVQFYGFCFKSQEFDFVFEFMPNNLRDLISKSEKVAFLIIVRMAIDVVSGVEFLHSKGILDTNLKSNNVLITDNYRVKLNDFGISSLKKCINIAQRNPTIRYRPPESFERNYSKTKEGDVYSVGMLMWEMGCWKLPFAEYSEAEILRKLEIGLQENIPENFQTSYAVLIRNCWQFLPGNRPKIGEIKERLEQIFLEATKP